MNFTFAQCITGPIKRRYRASRIDDHKWEPYYEEIRAKYVDENLTLDQLRQYMSKVHRFRPTKKQYTSYLNKQKIRKSDKVLSSEFGGPQSPPTPTDCQSPESNFEEEDPLDEPTSDLDQATIRPHANSTIRRAGVLLENIPAQQSLSHPHEDTLDEHILNAVFGVEDREHRHEDDPVRIRRTADIALFFLGHQSPHQFQQLLDLLQNIINTRPVDLHCHDYDVFGLLRLTRLLVHDSWSNTVVRLSRRVSLLICSFWKLDYDIFSHGRMFVELIAMSLLYCNGKSIAVDDLPRRTENPGHLNTSPIHTFADHLHQNCSRFIKACRKVTSQADWSLMLLGLHLDPSQQGSKELQIEHVAEFVLPAHIDGLSRILHWCIMILHGHGFRDLRRNVIDLCYPTPNSQEVMDARDVVAVERYILHYYFISSFWQLRGESATALVPLNPDDTAILSIYRTFLDDFALSEFDILRFLVDIFVSQLLHQDNPAAIPPSEPHYLSPEVLGDLSNRFSNRAYSASCKEVASWWLSCWMWGKMPSNVSDFRQTVLAAKLGNHALRSISQGIEETHPSNRAVAGTEQQLTDVEVLATLYEGIAGSRRVRLSSSGAERNSYNMTSSPTISKNQDQRYSGGSTDYTNFAKTGTRRNMSPPKKSPTLPSEGFQDLRDMGSDVSRNWGFSESSQGTRSGGTRSSGRKSISGLGLRNHVSARFSRHRKTSSSELVQEDTKLEDFFYNDRRCMSPRVMTENSLMA